MASLLFNIVLVNTLLILSKARKDGSIPLSACFSMRPGHPGQPQTTTSPYYISIDSALFIPERTLTVSLYTQDDSPTFRGFYCQGRANDNSSTTAGHFKVENDLARGHNCFSSASEETNTYDTASHSLSFTENPLTLLNLEWKTTDHNSEKVKFRCTFVQSYSVYWINVESILLRSLARVSAPECCAMESLSIGCNPLCRHVSETPNNTHVARNILESMTEENAICQESLYAIRCSYWSQSPDNFDASLVEECCTTKNISQNCMVFCDRETYSDTHPFNSYRGEFKQCMEENIELSLCIIYPAYDIEETSTSSPFVPVSPTSITSFVMPTSSLPSQPETTPFVMPNSSLPSQPETTSFGIQSNKKTSESAMDKHTTDFTVDIETSTSDEGITSADVVETTTTATTYFMSTNQSTFYETMTFPPQDDGVVIYLVTTVVNVEGALQDVNLQQRIFDALEINILIPSLEALFGYISVTVGVEVYEGSLIVLSEGSFLQQDDDSFPTLQDLENALQNRFDKIDGQVSDNNESWQINLPITVIRKAINGMCQDGRCKSSETCVEIGSDDFVCLCEDLNGEEQICVDETTESKLPIAGIVGIAVGLIVLIIFLIVMSVYFCRRKTTQTNRKRAMSTMDNESYVYPDTIMTNNEEEHIYSSLSISGVPPALPANNNSRATLPSNSMTYEQAASQQTDIAESENFKENDEGYMKPISQPDSEYTEPYVLYSTDEQTKKNLNADKSVYTEPYVLYSTDDQITEGLNAESGTNPDNCDLHKKDSIAEDPKINRIVNDYEPAQDVKEDNDLEICIKDISTTDYIDFTKDETSKI